MLILGVPYKFRARADFLIVGNSAGRAADVDTHLQVWLKAMVGLWHSKWLIGLALKPGLPT